MREGTAGRTPGLWIGRILAPTVLCTLASLPVPAFSQKPNEPASKNTSKSTPSNKPAPAKSASTKPAQSKPAPKPAATAKPNPSPAAKPEPSSAAAPLARAAATEESAVRTPAVQSTRLDSAGRGDQAGRPEMLARVASTDADGASAAAAPALSAAPTLAAAPAARTESTVGAAAQSAGARTVSLDLKMLGAWSTIRLRGGQGSRTLAFGVRADEQVVAAKLVVGYDFSPSLLEDLSHLKVSVNDRPVMLDALARTRASGVRREFTLDPSLLRDYNELRFDFVGDYTRQCSNPLHPSIWLNITDPTRVELTVVPKAVAPDLRTMPAPFIDKGDARDPVVPFVFSASPSPATLRAAGIVASWLGAQAGGKRLRITAHLNELPNENAIVFAGPDEALAGQPTPTGSRLALVRHPSSAAAKLLTVSGTSETEIQRAARALALNHKSLSGAFVEIRSETETQPRVPYDAPAWLRTDRAMKFGEFAKLEDLRTQGYFPEVIRVNYRVPPDVYAWHTHGAPMQLKYRATRLPHHRNSALGVGANNHFIDTIALNELAEKPEYTNVLHEAVQTSNRSLRELSMFVPPYSLGGRDQLQFAYSTDIIQTGHCEALPPNNFVASIDPESTLDFSAFPKFAALPNLAYFAQIGFPYTRLADLAQTSVVLPAKPGTAEIRLYLNVMNRMGEATGYPAIRHELTSATDLGKLAGRDIIIIGTAQDRTLMRDWAQALPMHTENGVRTVKVPETHWRPRFRWEQRDIDPRSKPPGELTLAGPGTLVALMGFESPVTPGRSAVYLYADKPSDLERIEEQLTHPEKLQTIAGDFVVVGEKSVQSTQASNTYFIGEIPWMTRVRWLLADHPLLVALAAMLLALLAAAALYRPLAMIRRRRQLKSKAGAGQPGAQ